MTGELPPEPYADLHVLGVDPAVCGRGLAAARNAGLVAYLKTSNAADLPFDVCHGVEVPVGAMARTDA